MRRAAPVAAPGVAGRTRGQGCAPVKGARVRLSWAWHRAGSAKECKIALARRCLLLELLAATTDLEHLALRFSRLGIARRAERECRIEVGLGPHFNVG